MSETYDAPNWPPKDCAQVCIWLNARSDNECTPAQEGWLADHLKDCPQCTKEWAEIEASRFAFQSASLRESGDFEREAVNRALAPSLLKLGGWIGICFGALAIALLILDDVLSLDNPLELIAVGVFYLGFALLFLRVLIERTRVRRSDPYRKIKR